MGKLYALPSGLDQAVDNCKREIMCAPKSGLVTVSAFDLGTMITALSALQLANTEKDAEIGRLKLLQFSPAGDNHHNAFACPYCNPDGLDAAKLTVLSETNARLVEAMSRHCYVTSESHLSGARVMIGFERLSDAQDAHEAVAKIVRGL